MKIAIVASQTDLAEQSAEILREKYEVVSADKADVIVALGGDGFMLHSLHQHLFSGTPIFGLNRGTVGFLMNDYSENGLMERINAADKFQLHPLRMVATDINGQEHTYLAINEVSLLRETRQAASLQIIIDGKPRLPKMSGDGLIVATPAGSTAYNLSAHGPILPIGANVLSITPISCFRPRRWRGALISEDSHIELIVRDNIKRPVSATADMHEVRDVQKVMISSATDVTVNLLFDPHHNLDERIFLEQFAD